MDKDTQELMDELREEGNTFSGDAPEAPKEETPTPQPEIKEEKKEPEGEKPEEEKPEETPEELPERAPRKPKEIPAWKAKIAEKRAAKEAKAEVEAKETPKENIKNEQKADEITDANDKIEKLKEKYKGTVTESFLDDLADLIPKSTKAELPEEVEKKLAKLDEILGKNQQENEDAQYQKSFSKEILPVLKEQYPHISDSEVQSIQDFIKDFYYDERYISLSPKEIYAIKASELKDLVSPPAKTGKVEKGTKGVSRGGDSIDYDNMTEEEYANLSDEEVDKANEYLAAKQRKR